jgi:hypothetical protein
MYNIALKKSREYNKSLLVVGDPYNGIGSSIYNIFMDGYDCGDETVDITGAPKCKNGIKDDILLYLKKQ